MRIVHTIGTYIVLQQNNKSFWNQIVNAYKR